MFVIVILTSLITFLVFILSTAAYLISIIVDDESDDDIGATATLDIDRHDFSTTPAASPIDSAIGRRLSIDLNDLTSLGSVCNCVKLANNIARNSSSSSSSTNIKTLNESSQNAQSGATNETLAAVSAAAAPAAAAAAPTATTATASSAESLSSAYDLSETQMIHDTAMLAAAASVTAGPEEVQSAEVNSKLLKASEIQRQSVVNEAAKSTTSLDSGQSQESFGGISSWHTSASAQKDLIASHLGNSVSKQIFDDFDSREMQLGGTALHWCRTRKCLDRLIKLGLPTDIVNKRNETALHVAVRRHKLQVLIGLLNYDANIEFRNDHGETALILACKVNDIYAVQLLLIFDANPTATDNAGLTARHYTASICDKNNNQQQLPSAAHLILAMLNEIGAERCPTRISSNNDSSKQHSCTDGCSPTGSYNGNSYNRWPSYKRESLYKRYMSSDLIDQRRRRQKTTSPSPSLRGGAATTAAPAATAADASPANPGRARMLCIDGGGLRGVIVCQIMIEMEKYLKRPMISYFNWIGGTSVGAFLACALCRGVPMRELRRICFDVKDEVFSGSKPYNSKFIERVLKRTFGTTTRMSHVKDIKLAVTSVLADRDPCQLKFFRNYQSAAQLLEMHGFPVDVYNTMSGHSIVTTGSRRQLAKPIHPLQPGQGKPRESPPATESKASNAPASAADAAAAPDPAPVPAQEATAANSKLHASKSANKTTLEVTRGELAQESMLDENDQDPLMWQVVRASAAAPFFFKPYGPFLDGGIISNNPTLDMLHEFVSHEKVIKFLRKHAKTSDKPLNDTEQSFALDSEPTGELDIVVSLGTGRGRVIGRQAMVDFGQIATGFSAVFSPVELVRSIRAARDLFKRLMHQSCHTDDHILDRAQAWCSSLDIPYFRLNPPLATIFSIDDKRDEQLINALWQTKLYMRAMKDQLTELSELLDNP